VLPRLIDLCLEHLSHRDAAIAEHCTRSLACLLTNVELQLEITDEQASRIMSLLKQALQHSEPTRLLVALHLLICSTESPRTKQILETDVTDIAPYLIGIDKVGGRPEATYGAQMEALEALESLLILCPHRMCSSDNVLLWGKMAVNGTLCGRKELQSLSLVILKRLVRHAAAGPGDRKMIEKLGDWLTGGDFMSFYKETDEETKKTVTKCKRGPLGTKLYEMCFVQDEGVVALGSEACGIFAWLMGQNAWRRGRSTDIDAGKLLSYYFFGVGKKGGVGNHPWDTLGRQSSLLEGYGFFVISAMHEYSRSLQGSQALVIPNLPEYVCRPLRRALETELDKEARFIVYRAWSVVLIMGGTKLWSTYHQNKKLVRILALASIESETELKSSINDFMSAICGFTHGRKKTKTTAPSRGQDGETDGELMNMTGHVINEYLDPNRRGLLKPPLGSEGSEGSSCKAVLSWFENLSTELEAMEEKKEGTDLKTDQEKKEEKDLKTDLSTILQVWGPWLAQQKEEVTQRASADANLKRSVEESPVPGVQILGSKRQRKAVSFSPATEEPSKLSNLEDAEVQKRHRQDLRQCLQGLMHFIEGEGEFSMAEISALLKEQLQLHRHLNDLLPVLYAKEVKGVRKAEAGSAPPEPKT